MTLRKIDANNPDFEAFENMLTALKEFLNEGETKLSLDEILNFQDEIGSFSLLDSNRVPSDARVDFIKMPSYIVTAILMREYLKGNTRVEPVLIKALDFVYKTRLSGHGYESEYCRIEALNYFIKGGLRQFLYLGQDLSPKFSFMINETLRMYKSKIKRGQTLGPWGEDYKEKWGDILKNLELKKLYIAYGSNMNREQMATRCPDAKVVGKTYLKDWELCLPSHANIERKKDASTPVLIWEISEEDEKTLDRYEGYPSFYTKRYLPINIFDTNVKAMAYVMTKEYERLDRPVRDGYVEGIIHGYIDAGFDASEFNPRRF